MGVRGTMKYDNGIEVTWFHLTVSPGDVPVRQCCCFLNGYC